MGIFLLILAIGVKTVVEPRLVKDPLTVPAKYSVLIAGGTGFLLFDAQTGSTKPVTIRITRTIHGDTTGKDGGNDSVAVYDESLCLSVEDGTHPGCLPATDPRMVLVNIDRIAFDRKTSLAVSDPKYGASVDGKPVTHEGLGYKFPIDTKKKTYLFFDPIPRHAYPINYVGTTKIQGLTVYKFTQQITDAPVYTGNVLPSLYTNFRTVFVEPTTGVIVAGSEQIDQRFTGRETLDPNSKVIIPQLAGQTALKGTLAFDQPTVNRQIKLAKDNKSKIELITTTIPLIGFIGGPLLILIGALLLAFGGRPKGEGEGVEADQTWPLGAGPGGHEEIEPSGAGTDTGHE